MMLLAQMVVPGVMAQDATPDAAPSAQTTVPVPPEDLDDILTPEETEESVPVVSETDLASPVTEESEGEGPVSTETGLPKDEQGPAAGSGSNVDVQSSSAPMTESRISPMAVVGPGVTSVTVTPTALADVCDTVRMDITWSVADTAQAGDTFTFTLDSRLDVPNTVIPLAAPDGVSIVANLRLVDGVATVTMTDYVDTHNNVRGTAWFQSASCWAEDYQGQTVNLTFTGQETIVIPVTVPTRPTPVPTEPPPTPTPGTNPQKSGKFTRADQGRTNQSEAIEWTITAPSGPSGGVALTDTAGSNWKFECGTISWLNNIQPVDWECDEGEVTATFGPYDAEWHPRPGFTIKATITGEMPEDPNDLLSFANTVTAQAKDWEGNPVDPGQASTNLGQTTPPTPTPTPDPNVTPTPSPTPTPGVNPDKEGTFTDSLDQGKTEPENALKWTVTAPPGPAGGITITDTAGPNWKFECETITYLNGIDPLDIDCSDDELIVTFGPYASAENPWWPRPGFTIEASITSPPSVSNKTFTNTVTTVVNGWDAEVEWEGEGSRTSSFQQSSSGGGGGIGDNERRPVTPGVTGNVCDGGVYTPPTITVNDPDSGLTYEIGEVDPETGEYTVTATLGQGQTWASLDGTGWEINPQNASQAIYNGTVDLVPCEPGDPDTVTPVAPTVTGNVCEAGEYTEPELVLATTPEGITYTIVQDIDENGDYIVSATLDEGLIWDDLDGTGWVVDEEDDSRAIYNGNVELAPCEPDTVLPVAPTVTGNVCVGGEYTEPELVLASTDGITYVVTQDIDENGEYIVKATLAEGRAWGDLTGTGWEINEDDESEAIYNGTVDLKPCIDAVPANPTVTGNVCEGGVYTAPTVVVAETPDGVTYVVTQDVDEDGEYVVTATLGEGQAWGDLTGTGWERTSDTVATYNGTVDLKPCEPVVPVAPSVTGNVCVGGSYTDPQVVTAQTPEGITYAVTQDIDEDGDYIVTATLSDGQEWGELPAGWERTSDTVATYNGSVDLKPCIEAIPVLPGVDEAVCTGGELFPPKVTLVETEGITYEIEGGIAPGATVIVTATLGDGYEWPAEMPEGWTKVDDTTATAGIALDDVACEEVIPAAPIVENAVCDFGGITDPSVTLQETDGITYELDGDIVPGRTVTVTATLDEGKAWGEMPDGWTRVNRTTATYEIVLDDPECIPAIPVNPIVNQAVCTGGGIVDPIVTTPTTDGIRYTFNEDDVVNGGTVVVTATVQTGYAWPEEMPEGWTRIDATTATFTVELDEVACEPVSPVIPGVTGNVCQGGVYTPPTIVVNDPESGLVYAIGTVDPVTGAYTVTATLGDGQEWGEMPDGWTITSPTTAQYSGTVDLEPCTTVVPEYPNVTPAVCEDDKVIDPVVTLPETPGVTYTIDGNVVPGGKVTVTATLDEGYEWGEMPEGWTRVSTTTAIFTIELATVTCEVPDTPTKPTSGEVKVTELPATGTGTGVGTLNAMLVAAIAGILAVIAAGLRFRYRMVGR